MDEGAFGSTLVLFWRRFGRTLEALCVYEGGFGSLYDHFGIIVESRRVYEGRFSKNMHSPHRF